MTHQPVPLKSNCTQIELHPLISEDGLESSLDIAPFPGEMDVLDSVNLMERGDYSGAVRRVTTAIEVAVAAALRNALLEKYTVPEVERRLETSMNDFPGRLRQYEKLSGRILTEGLRKELNATRKLRHEIVHGGKRVAFASRGVAQRCVDTGRWIFNWVENDSGRSAVRETRIAKRSIGRYLPIYDAGITADGVEVYPPIFEGK